MPRRPTTPPSTSARTESEGPPPLLFYYIKEDEPVILGINKVVDKLGKKGDDFCVYEYVSRNSYKLSIDTYTQLLKTILKLRENVFTANEFDMLTSNLLEKIPDDKTGEFTEALVKLLTTAGKKEYISILDDYLRNFGRVNKFMQQGQKTPQSIIDVIEKIKAQLLL